MIVIMNCQLVNLTKKKNKANCRATKKTNYTEFSPYAKTIDNGNHNKNNNDNDIDNNDNNNIIIIVIIIIITTTVLMTEN